MKAHIRAGPFQAPEPPLEGLEGQTEEGRPPTGRPLGGTAALGIAIVLTTLAGAGVEFAHAYDGMRGDAAGLRAQQLGVEASNRLVASQQQGLSQFDTFVVADEQRSNAANANQWLINPSAGIGSDTALREKTRWNQIAAVTEGLTDITRGSPTGPQQDPSFPYQYLRAKSIADADKAWALQDAANAEAKGWREITAKHAAVLTMLAIAVYLFGLSLTARLRINRYLAVLGLILLVVGSSWSIILQTNPIVRAPDAAAEEYAQGRAAFAAAYWKGSGSYQAARDHYSRAITLRQTFAKAYYERALVEFAMGSPQASQAIMNVTSPQNLRDAANDDLKAYENGLQNNDVLTNLGDELFLEGLLSGNTDHYASALVYTRQALSADSKDPLLNFNDAVQLLASNRFSESEKAYKNGIVQTLSKWANEPTTQENLLAGALTDLELVAKFRQDLAPRVQSLKQSLVAGILGPSSSSGPIRQVANLAAEIFPSTVQWTADLPDYNSTQDSVSVQWYYIPPATSLSSAPNVWQVLPDVSGNIQIGTKGDARWGKLWSDSSAAGPNAYFNENNYLMPTGSCLAGGRYRVEVYINGHPTVSNETSWDTATLIGQSVQGLGVQLCRPQAWQLSDKSDRGFVEGYVSTDGKSGLYVFRYEHPGPQSITAAVVKADLQRTIAVYGDRFPAPATFSAPDAYQIPQLVSVDGGDYSYSGGMIWADAGFNTNDIKIDGRTVTVGATIVIAVFGTADYVLSKDPSRIFESVIIT